MANVVEFINQLNSGEASYDDESSFTTYTILEEDLGKNVIKDATVRNKIKRILEKQIKSLDDRLSKMETFASISKNNNPK